MQLPPKLVSAVRGLRFRLTISYFAIFALLLVVIGLYFRANLKETLDYRMREIVEEEWAAVRGYLRIENGHAVWYFDPKDPEESSFVEKLRRIILVTDASGQVLEASNGYRALGLEERKILQSRFSMASASSREFVVRSNSKGDRVLVCAGVARQAKLQYYLAIGHSLADNALIPDRFTWDYFTAVPLMLILTGLIGWLIAGRALSPVNDVARAAQRMSGSNLSIRIPTRGSGDELDNLIETFNRMMDRLKVNFDQMRQFSTDASHELRTPLTAIRGQLEVALFTATTADQFKDAVVNSLQDVEQLSNIVRALLMLSHAETGQLVLQKSPMLLANVVEDIADQFQIPAEEAKVQLTVSADKEVIVAVDRVQIGRLISNLLSNAVKYTPPGGKIQTILRFSPNRQWAEFIVEDTGQGIAESHLPHIFERFYKVPDANPEKGLGLGLSFVAWIVKAHGGTIKVKSDFGVGTRFEVTLPIAFENPTAIVVEKKRVKTVNNHS